MAVKDFYCSFDTLTYEAMQMEPGILSYMIKDYMKLLAYKQNTPSIKNLLYPHYPFDKSFLESLLALYRMDHAKFIQYERYIKSHLEEITEDTELPVFTNKYTFDSYLTHRLNKILMFPVHPNTYYKYYNNPILVADDNLNAFILRSKEDFKNIELLGTSLGEILIHPLDESAIVTIHTFSEERIELISRQDNMPKMTTYRISSRYKELLESIDGPAFLRAIKNIINIWLDSGCTSIHINDVIMRATRPR